MPTASRSLTLHNGSLFRDFSLRKEQKEESSGRRAIASGQVAANQAPRNDEDAEEKSTERHRRAAQMRQSCRRGVDFSAFRISRVRRE